MFMTPFRTPALPRRLRRGDLSVPVAGPCIAVLMLALLLTGCGQPDGDRPAAIVWDRDTCEYCRMTISDRAHAAEAWIEPQHRHHKFDDIGCMVNWLHASGRSSEQARLWVADHNHRDQVHWLDARKAWYQDGQTTPMDYGYGATDKPGDGAVDFDTASANMLKRDERR